MSFDCGTCDNKFTSEAELYLHEVQNHIEVGSLCLLCNKFYTNINYHIKKDHNEEYLEYKKFKKGTIQLPYKGIETTCRLCKHDTRGKQFLVKHIQNEHLEPQKYCEICKAMIASTNYYDHMNLKHSQKEDATTCEICKILCKTATSYRKHIQSEDHIKQLKYSQMSASIDKENKLTKIEIVEILKKDGTLPLLDEDDLSCDSKKKMIKCSRCSVMISYSEYKNRHYASCVINSALGKYPGASNWERIVCKYLMTHNYEFVREHKEPDLKNNGKFLRYDFFLPDDRIIIEVHGIQHYESMGYTQSEEKFKQTQDNDKIKKIYAMEHYKKFIEIDTREYNDEDKITEFLSQELPAPPTSVAENTPTENICPIEMSFYCKICNIKFDTHAEVYIHKMENHVTMGSLCLLCNEKFLDIDDHCEKFHNTEYQDGKKNKSMHKLYKDMNTICEICGKDLKNKKCILKHVRTHFETPVVMETPKSPDIFSDQEKIKTSCEFAGCNRHFTSQGGELVHKWLDHEKTGICCQLCGKNYQKRQVLLKHVNNVHFSEKVQCPKCGLFLTAERLKEGHKDTCKG